MWEFAQQLLEQYGLMAVIVLATYAGLGAAIRALWIRLATAQDATTKAAKEHTEAIAKEKHDAILREAQLLREEHEKRSAMRTEHEKELTELREQQKAEARYYAERLDTLQEKRNDELRDVLRESLEHIASTRQSVDKITDTMSALRDVIRGRT